MEIDIRLNGVLPCALASCKRGYFHIDNTGANWSTRELQTINHEIITTNFSAALPVSCKNTTNNEKVAAPNEQRPYTADLLRGVSDSRLDLRREI